MPGEKTAERRFRAGKGAFAMRQVLRTEKKYILTLPEASALTARLRALLHRDGHSHGAGYLVRSLYFDTPEDRDYWDKADGVEQRQKLRLRVYDPGADTAYLELKQKQGDAQQKRSLPVPRADAQRLCAGDYECLLGYSAPFAAECFTRLSLDAYRPKVVVDYHRMAFTVPENATRITLDSDLRACASSFDIFDPALAALPARDPFLTTLEVKYDHFLLGYVRDILAAADKTPTSASKYAAARELFF